MLADFKGIDFQSFIGYKHYFMNNAVIEALNLAYGILQERMANPSSDFDPLFLIVDEWAGFISSFTSKKDQDAAKQKLASILMLGRGCLIFVILTMQRADASQLTGRDNFGNVVGLGNLSPESKRMVFPDLSDQIKPQLRGHGYLLTDGKPLKQITVPQLRNVSASLSKIKASLK